MQPAAVLPACLIAVSCAAPLAEIREVVPAPESLRPLAFAVELDGDVGGYWGRKRLGRVLVTALKDQMERDMMKAGYRMLSGHQEATEPALVLRVAAAIDGATRNLRTRTQLEVLHRGRLIDRFELQTPFHRSRVDAENYPTIVSHLLTNRVSESDRIVDARIEPIAPEPIDRPTVAVSFGVSDPSEQLDEVSRAQLGDYLVARATQGLGFRFVPNQRVRNVLRREKREGTAACFDAACQIELGRALAAEKTLVAKLIRVGDACALTAQIFDLTTEIAQAATTVETRCQADDLLAATDRLIERLRGTLPDT